MTPHRFNHKMQSELQRLLREQIINDNTYNKLQERYPITEWDWTSLGRWFGLFGAISLGAGIVLFAREIFEFTAVTLAWLLGIVMMGFFAGGFRLNNNRFNMTRRSLELCGAFTLIGLTFTLGYIFSSGSGNWPALLLIDLIILLPLAYGLHNVLVLILSAVVFFVWFGGFTGYDSGWGAYWFGMNYPLRFLLAAAIIILISLLHRTSERTLLSNYRDFYKVWLSAGIYFGEMALWLLSLFGNFNLEEDRWHRETAAELLLFNLLWAVGNSALIALGTRSMMRMLRGYGITFLVIHGYTLYFWHIAEKLGIVLASAVAGAAALGLVFWFEKQRKERQVET
ncbi:MAG: DUF2157 domain-containing protein [Methylococcaceae bacterium]|nr:DUF2157 domain-containing protein [Methylococcaceae bacterium]